MKKLVTLLALSVGMLVVAPTEAKADTRRFVGYDRCGNQVYQVSCFAGYDRCGYPVYRTRTEVVACRPRACDVGPRFSAGWSGGGFRAGYSSGGLRFSVGRGGYGHHGRCR